MHILLYVACKSGEYGRKCAFQCAENCNGPCGHIDGSCQYCKEGWKGLTAQKVINKEYFENSFCDLFLFSPEFFIKSL